MGKKLTNRRLTGIVFLVSLSGLITGSLGNAAPATKPIELRLATHMPKMHFYVTTVLVPFTKEFENRTNGRAKVTIYDSGTLGKVSEMYDIVKDGTADIAVVQPEQERRSFRLQEIFDLPYLIPGGNSDPTGNRIRRMLFEKYLGRIEFKDVRVLWTARWDDLQLMTVKKAVRTVSDAKGLSIGMTGGKMTAEFLKAIGASPEQVLMPEMYTALERAIVDGVVMGPEPLLGYKLNEVVKYVTYIDLAASVFFAGMNHRAFNSLPTDVQKVILDMIPWVEDLQAKVGIGRKQLIITRSKERGVEFITLAQNDRKRLVEVTKHLKEVWVSEMKKMNLPGKEMLDDVYRLLGTK